MVRGDVRLRRLARSNVVATPDAAPSIAAGSSVGVIDNEVVVPVPGDCVERRPHLGERLFGSHVLNAEVAVVPVEANELGAEIVRDRSEDLGGATAGLGHVNRDPHHSRTMSDEPRVVATIRSPKGRPRVEGRPLMPDGARPCGADGA